MVRSSSRNNFVDILRDPLVVTMMASIGLHAVFGAFLLPIISRVPPEGKKIETSTVKVVELTPNELQRIPQVPTPIPTPDPVTLPPVYQPSPPVAPTVPTATTIPATPVRTPTPKTPTKPKVTNAQTSQPEPKSSGVDFNPEPFINPSPSPKQTKSPGGKKGETKPSPKPTPTPSIKPPQPTKKDTTKTLITPTPSPETNAGSDDGGVDGGQSDGSSPQPSPSIASPQPTATPSTAPTGLLNPSPGAANPSSTSSPTAPREFYGDYTLRALAQLKEFEKKYPNLKKYPPQTIKRKYPDGMVCSKTKQPPFIVLMAVFSKATPSSDDNILGVNSTSNSEIKVFKDETTSETKKLSNQIAIDAAVTEINDAEKKRLEEEDKDKTVLHQYRVEFDPKSCKN